MDSFSRYVTRPKYPIVTCLVQVKVTELRLVGPDERFELLPGQYEVRVGARAGGDGYGLTRARQEFLTSTIKVE